MAESILLRFETVYFRVQKKFQNLIVNFSIAYSRILAHKYRKEIVRERGVSVIDSPLKKRIKEYARERFGKSAYWPWLALYTEVRGQFIKGWIPHDYFRYTLLPKINPPTCCQISEQKSYDYRLFGEFAIRPLYLFISGLFFNLELDVVKNSQVKEFFSEYNDCIVVKEDRGTKGRQVRFMHSSEFLPEMLYENVNYLIQPYIKQYHVLESLNPESLNTFRVTTFLNRSGSVDIKFVVLRFGVGGSKVDNISSGGNFIYFDSFGKPSKYSYNIQGTNTGDRHKSSGYVFADIKIPMFNLILEKCRSAHKKYPYTRLIGWDVCIDYSGEPKLIEWNADGPGFWFWEDIFGPFWPTDVDF